MNYITTTQLRTKTPELINTLLSGGSINLVHRSKIVGEIIPKKSEPKIFNAARFEKIVKQLKFKPLTRKEAENNYRDHIINKYGQGLSGH
jgi:antitoxin (DNA-binding transcriptional repressor) of toxin-antitoxin stability system